MDNLTNCFGESDNKFEKLTIYDQSGLYGIHPLVRLNCGNAEEQDIISNIIRTRKYIFSEDEIIKKDEVVAYCKGDKFNFIIRKPISYMYGNLVAKVTVIDSVTENFIKNCMMEIRIFDTPQNKYVYATEWEKEHLDLNFDFHTNYIKSKSDGKISLRKNMHNIIKLSKTTSGYNMYEEIYKYLDDFSGKSSENGFYKFICELTGEQEIDYKYLTSLSIYYLSTVPIFIVGRNERGEVLIYNLLDGYIYAYSELYSIIDTLTNSTNFLSRYKDKLDKIEIMIYGEDEKWQYTEDFYINKSKTIPSEEELIIFLKKLSGREYTLDSAVASFIENLEYPLKITYEPGTEDDVLYIEQPDDFIVDTNNYILNLSNPSECYPIE